MKVIEGKLIDCSFIDGILESPSDELFYYDGPLLTHFKAGKDYFVHFCDSNTEFARWALVELTPESVGNYLTDKTELRETLLSGPTWIFESDSEVILRAWKMEIPEEYLPLEGCFYTFAT